MRFLLIGIFISIVLSSATCIKSSTIKHSPIDTTVDYEISYRPTYHFAPRQNWLNDPNGLVYYNGKFHLFFQHNPVGIIQDHLSWGHATSKDLMQWEELPVAIPEYKNEDQSVTMIFSGTAVVDSSNTTGFATQAGMHPLVAIYTSHVDKKGPLLQHQSIAYSLDGISFRQYHNNPVLDIQAKDFRDPKVFWHHPTNKWIMIVAKPDQFKVHFYSSSDLKSWTFLSEFGGVGNVDKIWECPDLFELPVEGSNEKKWVLTVSAGHSQKGFLAMQYFVGNFNGSSFTADNLPYPQYLDYGKDFYAGIIYNNLPSADTRKIMMGWANCWEYAQAIPTKAFRGMMAIPRVLSLVKSNNGHYQLMQQPVEEVNKYREAILFSPDDLPINNAVNNCNNIKGDALDIEFTMTRNDAAQAGIKVFKVGNEETVIYFNKQESTINIDRRKSGYVNFSNRFSSVESVPIAAGNSDLKFRILIDKSIVEVFVNDGEKVLTDQVFPAHSNGGVELFSAGGTTRFKNVKVWKMQPSM
jgi:fructan beta-fructosidase